MVYCICKIAVEIVDDAADDKDGTNIRFKQVTFRQLPGVDYPQLCQDTSPYNGFRLDILPVSEMQGPRILGLFVDPNRVKKFRSEKLLNLLKFGFNFEPTKASQVTENSIEYCETYQHRKQAISQLFQLLREAHATDTLDPRVNDIPETGLLKATLRSYQTRAVRWLLHREIAKDTLPHGFIEINCREMPELKFFLQPDYLGLADQKPNDIQLPTGGILADEMGLGKTIEMLALFVLNKRNLVNSIESNSDYAPAAKKERMEVVCVCGKKTLKNLIACRLCQHSQHQRCTRKYSNAKHDDVDYICPQCWNKQPLTKSGATIIVSPAVIKLQWKSEISKHSNSLRLFVYEGVVTTGWISPIELSEYDIVLTDYNVLTKEMDFSANDSLKIQLRGKQKYIRKLSPLNMIDWWRAVLDEAQMVESGIRKSAKMVKGLTATHRWAVTGTPIQKSIDDIRGLLEYLEIAPYQEPHIWQSLSVAFQNGNKKPLMDVLAKVMWRTCKSTVLEELGIPPQSEKVHRLEMSDVQRLFYRGQHLSCASDFFERIQKYSIDTMALSEINPHILKNILEPLRKLRQDCTVPVIFKKIEQSLVKKCLKPQELVAHLKMTNEVDCKNQLRSMVSSINGIAALHIICEEYDEAAERYRSVLSLSKKYDAPISVDTLQQIHALHNLTCLFEMKPTIPDLNENKINDYKSQCEVLEWKYLSFYNDSLQKARKCFLLARNSCKEMETKIPGHQGSCWLSLLVTINTNNLDTRFIEKVNEEKRQTNSTNSINFHTTNGISYHTIVWIDKLFEARKKVLKEVEKFEPYIENIRPTNQARKKVIHRFVDEAFACHLNELRSNEKSTRRKNQRQTLCGLCKTKELLDSYECIIFSKTFHEKGDNNEGSWNPSFEETICKLMVRFARINNIYDDDVRNCSEFLKLIECMKNEYKELVKLWIESEYTVKAYDELNMCKMRLQLYDLEGLDEKSVRENYQLTAAEVEWNMEQLNGQHHAAEAEFNLKLSRINYLKHLESNEDPGICPICKHRPDVRYSVLQCGHHMCMMCLVGMKQFQKNILTCAICRFRQKYEEVYYVTRKPIVEADSSEIVVTGQYSSKVERIVREVLKLKQSDENVRILIFSHWTNILEVIANALIANDVKIAFKADTKKSIHQFKDPNSNITCLLLMLSQGSKGINLTEASHVFLIEPILNPGEEQQAVSRVHRIGQTKPTTVHRFIMLETIEEKIFQTISNDDPAKWEANDITISTIESLFSMN